MIRRDWYLLGAALVAALIAMIPVGPRFTLAAAAGGSGVLAWLFTTLRSSERRAQSRPSAISPGKALLAVFVLVFYSLAGWIVYAHNTPADADMLSSLGTCEHRRVERLLGEGFTVSKMDVYSAKDDCQQQAEESELLREQTQALRSAAPAAASEN